MRKALAVLAIMLCPIAPALAQVSFAYESPGVSIGINVPAYPELVRIPGYPVYYAPQLDANYFFYDGLYWVFNGSDWYVSPWYNGPWRLVVADAVPLFVLRVPVRYYREPPVYFRGWALNAPPRWAVHWGDRWARHHRGWDRWDRHAAPRPAPLPTYQRRYAGSRYPGVVEQRTLERRNYQYAPRDRYAQRVLQAAPAPGPRTTTAQRNAPTMANRAAPPARIEHRAPPAMAHSGAPPARIEHRAPPAMAHRGAPPASIEHRAPPAMAHRGSEPRAAATPRAPRSASPPLAQHGSQRQQARAEPPGRGGAHGGPAANARARGGPPANAHARGGERREPSG